MESQLSILNTALSVEMVEGVTLVQMDTIGVALLAKGLLRRTLKHARLVLVVGRVRIIVLMGSSRTVLPAQPTLLQILKHVKLVPILWDRCTNVLLGS